MPSRDELIEQAARELFLAEVGDEHAAAWDAPGEHGKAAWLNRARRLATIGLLATPVQQATDSQARNEMLRELLTALGDDLHARDQTPKSVWQEALEKVRALSGEAPDAQ